MEKVNSINGSKNPLANLFKPINNPRGTPKIIPSTNPKRTLKKESQIWPMGTGILNRLNSPVTTLKTLLLKFGSTTPNSLWTGYLPGIISAIQSGKIKPTILLTFDEVQKNEQGSLRLVDKPIAAIANVCWFIFGDINSWNISSSCCWTYLWSTI